MKSSRDRLPVPGWLFLTAMVVYHELMLHIRAAQALSFHRLSAVTLFALGFGTLLALPVSLIRSSKAEKTVSIISASILAVVYFAMYVIFDVYQSFLTPATIIGGAGGVAADYLSIALTAIFQNFRFFAALAAPIVLYALFCRGADTAWWLRSVLAAACVTFYLLGFGAVQLFGVDAARLDKSYDFDSAVKSFGLNMGLMTETVRTFSGAAAEPEFLPTQPPAFPTEVPETTAPPVVYEPHAFAPDFHALAEAETRSGIASLHSYVASQTPTTENEFTGLFAGKNLIFITAEAFSSQVIDPVRTPTLHRLATRGIRFEEYYQPAWGGSTTSGEFSNLIGIVPTGGGTCMKEAIEQNLFLTIGNRLWEQGYHSVAYHNHSHTYYNRDETHTRLGYDAFIAMGSGLEAGVAGTVPESDLEMMEFTVPQFIHKQPFSVYYMTMSGHALYSRSGNAMARKNYHRVADLPYPEAVKCYLAANMELEDALASLLTALEAAGITDDTVIVLAADHYPYALEKSSAWGNDRNYLTDLYGTKEIDCFVRDRSTLIIWSGSIEDLGITVEEPVYSLDILPTLLNLFGLEFDSRLLVGRDVFSDAAPLVLWPDHSWKTDLGSYNAATGSFTPAENAKTDDSYREQMDAIVANKITYSKGVQKQDYFSVVADLLGK